MVLLSNTQRGQCHKIVKIVIVMIVKSILCSPNVVKQLTKVIFTSFVALSNPTFVEFLCNTALGLTIPTRDAYKTKCKKRLITDKLLLL